MMLLARPSQRHRRPWKKVVEYWQVCSALLHLYSYANLLRVKYILLDL